MKKGTLIIGLLVAVCSLFAQDGRSERRKMRIEDHKERLNLTEEQTAELKKLGESLKPELEALRKDDSKSRSEKMRAHADILEKRENEIAKILNSEQMAELEVIKDEMKDKRQNRRKERKGN